MTEPTTKTGTILKLITDRGFGFLTDSHDSQQIFFHRSALEADGFDRLSEGQAITYVEQPNSERGPRASAVAPA